MRFRDRLKTMKRAMLMGLLVLWSFPAGATVSTSTHTISYTPAAPTSSFTVTYPFDAKDDLTVTMTLIASPFTETVLVRGTGYSVTLPTPNSNGSITMISPATVTSTHSITITRATARTQTLSLTAQSAFNPVLLEKQLDKQVMMVQEIVTDAGADAQAAVDSHVADSDPHTGYAILAGRSGGQYLKGSTTAGEDLQLSAGNATGQVIFGSAGTTVYDEATSRLGVGDTTPDFTLDVEGTGYIANALALGDGQIIRVNATGTMTLSGSNTSAVGTGVAGSIFYGSSHATKANDIEIYLDTLSLIGTTASTTYLSLDDTTGEFTFTSNSINLGPNADVLKTTTSDVLVLGGDTSAPGSSAAGFEAYGSAHATFADYAKVYGDAITFANVGDNLMGAFAWVSTSYDSVFLVTAVLQARGDYNAGAGSYTTSSVDCGGVVYTSTDNAIITLPNAGGTNVGCQVVVQNTAADGAALISVQPDSSDGIKGSCVGITGAGAATVVQFSGTANKAINNTKATQNEGDYWVGVSDGSAYWWTIGCIGEWASTP